MPRRRKNLVRRFRRNPEDLETLEKIVDACELYTTGASRRQIGKKLSIDARTLNKWLAHLLPDPNAPDPRVEQAKELYRQGVSKAQIQKRLRVSDGTLNKWLEHESKIQARKNAVERLFNIARARELYEQTGLSKYNISRLFSVGVPTVDDWIRGLNKHHLKRLRAQEIYQKTGSIREVARLMQCGRQQAAQWVQGAEYVNPKIQQARDIYSETGSLTEAARQVGVSRTTVRRWVKKKALRRRNPDPWRNRDQDIKDAIQHAYGLGGDSTSLRIIEHVRPSFIVTQIESMPLDEIFDYTAGDWAEWAEDELQDLDEDELYDELTAYRSPEWAQRTIQQFQANDVPAIVIVDSPTYTGVGDGRGRISYALGMGVESLPAIIVSTTDSFDERDYRDNPENLETLETIAKARKLYQDGHSITEIRKRLQVRWNAVRQWVDDLIEDKSSLQQRARELYAETKSIKEVAERLGVTRYHIDPAWIADIRDTHRKQRIAEARQVYQQTNSIEQAARAVGVSYYRAKEWLLDLIPKKPEIDPRRERARQLYLQGKSIAAVAKAVHAKWDRVKGWVEDLIQEDTRPQRARELYQELGNYKSVARQLGVGWRTVRNWVSQRNPDDLEALEQMVRARKLYQESGSINAVAKELFGKTGPSYFYRVRTWVEDMIPPSKKLKKDYSEQIEQARALYQQGVTSSIKLAKAAGVSQATAYKWIHKGLLGEPPVDPRIAKAIDVYKTTHSLTQAARAVRASVPTVKKWVADVALPEDNRKDICIQAYLETGNIRDAAREAGVDHKKAKKWITEEEAEYVDPRVEQARELYRQTKSIKAVARSMPGTARITIRKWVEDLMPKGADPRIAKAIELRKEGMGLKAIGRALKADYRTVRKWVSQRNPDTRLRELERIFNQSPTYYNLARLEAEKQRKGLVDYSNRNMMADIDDEVTIEGEVWSCTVVYEPGHYSNNTVERVSIAHIIVDDDDLEIEVDVMPLLSKEEIKALEDKITERGWDEYCDWRDNQF